MASESKIDAEHQASFQCNLTTKSYESATGISNAQSTDNVWNKPVKLNIAQLQDCMRLRQSAKKTANRNLFAGKSPVKLFGVSREVTHHCSSRYSRKISTAYKSTNLPLRNEACKTRFSVAQGQHAVNRQSQARLLEMPNVPPPRGRGTNVQNVSASGSRKGNFKIPGMLHSTKKSNAVTFLKPRQTIGQIPKRQQKQADLENSVKLMSLEDAEEKLKKEASVFKPQFFNCSSGQRGHTIRAEEKSATQNCSPLKNCHEMRNKAKYLTEFATRLDEKPNKIVESMDEKLKKIVESMDGKLNKIAESMDDKLNKIVESMDEKLNKIVKSIEKQNEIVKSRDEKWNNMEQNMGECINELAYLKGMIQQLSSKHQIECDNFSSDCDGISKSVTKDPIRNTNSCPKLCQNLNPSKEKLVANKNSDNFGLAVYRTQESGNKCERELDNSVCDEQFVGSVQKSARVMKSEDLSCSGRRRSLRLLQSNKANYNYASIRKSMKLLGTPQCVETKKNNTPSRISRRLYTQLNDLYVD